MTSSSPSVSLFYKYYLLSGFEVREQRQLPFGWFGTSQSFLDQEVSYFASDLQRAHEFVQIDLIWRSVMTPHYDHVVLLSKEYPSAQWTLPKFLYLAARYYGLFNAL
jgi:hypothetical protein